MSFMLNYDDAIHLDAEALAEAGIAEAYERLLPRLRTLITHPLEIIEERDDDIPSYFVRCGGKSFAVYGPDIDDMGDSWQNATVALFTIVNGLAVHGNSAPVRPRLVRRRTYVG
jgi:hypothetical protein